MTYPNGQHVEYLYESGVDDRISRLSAFFQNESFFEKYSYLGLGTLVKLSRWEDPLFGYGLDLTYISGAAGEAGDQYAGLDRFGRIIDQHWVHSGSGTYDRGADKGADKARIKGQESNRVHSGSGTYDRFRYGYDKNGNRLYRENVLDTTTAEKRVGS